MDGKKEVRMKDEMDIFREVTTIASAHGSYALSEILKRNIKLTLPVITSICADDILKSKKSNKMVVVVESRILSGLEGKILLVFEEKSAYQLINILYSTVEEKEKTTSGFFTEVGLSVLREISNVVIGSYVGALSMFLKILIVPSIPTLISGPLSEVLSSITSGKEEYILLIEAIFEEEKSQIKGSIYFILTEEGMNTIKNACKKMLDSL